MLARAARFAHGSPLRRNATTTFTRQLVASIAQLLTVVMIARALGPEGNGLYAMAIMMPTLLVQLMNFGIGPATVYYLGRGTVSSRQAIRENLHLALGIGTLGIVIAVPVIMLWGGKIFPAVPVKLLFLGMLAFPITLLLAFWTTVLQGMEDFRAYNLTVLVPPLVTLLFTGFALLVFAAGVEMVLLAYISGQAVGLWQVWRSINRVGPGWGGDLHAPAEVERYKRKVMGYGWKAHLSNMMAFINYRADIFLVNFLLNPSATGIYVIAVQLAERLWMLSQAVSTVLLPRLSAMHGDPVGRYALTIRAGIIVGGITLMASAVLAIALYFLLGPVFGMAYQASFEPFLWLLPGVVAGAASRIQSNCIAAAGKPVWNFYVSILVVMLNILGNWFLIPIFDIEGAAMATTLIYGLNALIKVALVRKTLVLQ